MSAKRAIFTFSASGRQQSKIRLKNNMRNPISRIGTGVEVGRPEGSNRTDFSLVHLDT